MPKFKVCVQQYVEMIASVVVEAATPEEAADMVEQDGASEFDWQDGDDAEDMRVYAVLDESGEAVLEL